MLSCKQQGKVSTASRMWTSCANSRRSMQKNTRASDSNHKKLLMVATNERNSVYKVSSAIWLYVTPCFPGTICFKVFQSIKT
eukprot:6473958-Amphidinium_carterae.2